jgi:hypothetical protein
MLSSQRFEFDCKALSTDSVLPARKCRAYFKYLIKDDFFRLLFSTDYSQAAPLKGELSACGGLRGRVLRLEVKR